MAAIANLPSLTPGGLVQCSTVGGKKVWARADFGVATASSSSSSCASLKWRGRRNLGSGSSVPLADRAVLFMIQNLACACKRDRKLQQLVCNAVDKGSEISGSQVLPRFLDPVNFERSEL